MFAHAGMKYKVANIGHDESFEVVQDVIYGGSLGIGLHVVVGLI